MRAPATAPQRTEHDLLGERDVPAGAYYGVHTLRAVENFPLTGTPVGVHTALVVALACVKQAAALANRDLGLLDHGRADAIVRACGEIRAGRLHDAFVVDVLQGGAGTSTNMNANEVIANRALELLGHPAATTTNSTRWSTSTSARAPTTPTPRPSASRCRPARANCATASRAWPTRSR
ncbi:hypothetical protein GCM10025734_07400 [Kitasatospora paranensis]